MPPHERCKFRLPDTDCFHSFDAVFLRRPSSIYLIAFKPHLACESSTLYRMKR